MQFVIMLKMKELEGKMEIEHLGYKMKSDDTTFEIKLKPEKTIDEKEARELIEKFFDIFSVKVNVVTLTKFSEQEGKTDAQQNGPKIPNMEKRQFVLAHHMPKNFTIYDYIDYFMGQGFDMDILKKSFNNTIRPLLQDGRIQDTGQRRGRVVIYEVVQTEKELFVRKGETYVDSKESENMDD